MADRIHFKLDYNGDIQKFASTLHDDELFRAVMAKVASIVNADVLSSSYKLYWQNADSNVVLDSVADLNAAIEQAKSTRKITSKYPCVLLIVDSMKSKTLELLMAAIKQIAAEENVKKDVAEEAEDAKQIEMQQKVELRITEDEMLAKIEAETAAHRAAKVKPEEKHSQTAFQEYALEERFCKRGCSIYPQNKEMEEIAATNAMSDDQVNEWFKARRAEMRHAPEMKIRNGSKNLNKSAQTAADIEMNEALVKVAMQALDKSKAQMQALKAATTAMGTTPELDIKTHEKSVIPTVEQEWVRLEAEWNERVALAVEESEKKKGAEMESDCLDSSEDEDSEEEEEVEDEYAEEEEEDDLSTAYEPSLSGSEDSDEESEDECDTAVELSEGEEDESVCECDYCHKRPRAFSIADALKDAENFAQQGAQKTQASFLKARVTIQLSRLQAREAAIEAREETLARRMAEFAVMMEEYEGKMTALMGRVEEAYNEDINVKMDDIEERLEAIEEMY